MPPTDQDTYNFQTSPIHRAMIMEEDGDRRTLRYYEINDKVQLAAFEELFSGYRDFEKSDSNEWKGTKYRIYMCLYAGRTIKLISDGQRWGVTFGSFPINGDLESFIATMKPTLVRPDAGG
jgi:hypothetical protein